MSASTAGQRVGQGWGAAALAVGLWCASAAAGCGGSGETTCMPPSGGLRGGYEVRINGAGFERGVMVDFGGQRVKDVKYIGETTIAVTAPPAEEAGKVDIVVTSPTGKRMLYAKAFEYTLMAGLDTDPGAAKSGAPASAH